MNVFSYTHQLLSFELNFVGSRPRSLAVPACFYSSLKVAFSRPPISSGVRYLRCRRLYGRLLPDKGVSGWPSRLVPPRYSIHGWTAENGLLRPPTCIAHYYNKVIVQLLGNLNFFFVFLSECNVRWVHVVQFGIPSACLIFCFARRDYPENENFLLP